jgi:hypothetical protein
MDCKDSTGEVFVNIMEKVVQAGLGTGARLFLEVLVQFPVMARGKPSENGQTGNILIKVYPFNAERIMMSTPPQSPIEIQQIGIPAGSVERWKNKLLCPLKIFLTLKE